MTSEQARRLKIGDLVTIRKKEYKGFIFMVDNINRYTDRASDWCITVVQPFIKSPNVIYKARAHDMDIFQEEKHDKNN